MKVSIDKELAQALLTYLSRQPYGEVFQLVHALAQAQPVTGLEPKRAGTPDPKKDQAGTPKKDVDALAAAKAKLKKQLEEVVE